MERAILQLLTVFIFAVSCLAQSKQPKVIKYEAPKYPAAARATRTQGEVTTTVKIDSKGNVSSVEVLDGHPLLREASEIASKGWKFSSINENREREAKLIFSFRIKNKYRDDKVRTKFKKPNQIEVITGTPQLDI